MAKYKFLRHTHDENGDYRRDEIGDVKIKLNRTIWAHMLNSKKPMSFKEIVNSQLKYEEDFPEDFPEDKSSVESEVALTLVNYPRLKHWVSLVSFPCGFCRCALRPVEPFLPSIASNFPSTIFKDMRPTCPLNSRSGSIFFSKINFLDKKFIPNLTDLVKVVKSVE